MKKLNLFLSLLFTALLLVNCSSDDNGSDAPTISPPSNTGFNKLQADALSKITQKKTFKAEDGITFISKQGTTLRIDKSNLFTSKGDVVTGDVDLEFIEFYDRATMLPSNKPLMARNKSGGLEPLLTGGQFYVNVSQKGVALQTHYYHMDVPAANTGGLDEKMTMWEGRLNNADNLEWFEFIPGQELGGVFPDAEANQYQVYLKDFGWSNVDRLANVEGEKTPIRVQVPERYDNKNSSVYISYKGETGMLAFLDLYDVATKTFTEHFGWGPIGFELYIIFVSESNSKFVYAIQEVKLEKNKIYTFKNEDLATATEEQLTAIIKALP